MDFDLIAAFRASRIEAIARAKAYRKTSQAAARENLELAGRTRATIKRSLDVLIRVARKLDGLRGPLASAQVPRSRSASAKK